MLHNRTEIQLFGDVSLNGLFCDPLYQRDLQKSLEDLDHKIGQGQLRIINWEAPITKLGCFNPAKNPAIATTPASATVFCDAFHIDIATLGNNHIGDCLQEGMDTTLDFFAERNIKTLGAENTQRDTLQPIITEIDNHKIGVLSFIGAETNPKIPEELDIHVNTIDEQTIYNTITECSSQVNYLLVALHWGIEFIQYPSPTQKEIARKCIDAGASVIIGHHSHCLQGYEKYKEGLIFYSLGNFIFSGLKGKESFGWPAFCNRGGFYKLFISQEGGLSAEFIPFLVSNKGAVLEESNKSLKIQNRLSQNLNSNQFWYKWIYRTNLIKNWFIRLPLFLIKSKGGVVKALLFYFKAKYFKLILSYFFKK